MNPILGRYAVGGFCAGLVAGGLMVALLHLFSGGSLGLPLLFAVGGAAGAWMTFR